MNIVEDGRQCNIYLYADDAKIYQSIVTDDDANSLQRVVSRITEWCSTWLLKLNINKFVRPRWPYVMRPSVCHCYSLGGAK